MVVPVFNPYLMKSWLAQMPNTATAHINYISVLSQLENYIIPTTPNLSVDEIFNSRIYSWYPSSFLTRSDAAESELVK